MSRTFAYVRVSTAGQTAENQSLEIAAAGFSVEPHRVVIEPVSGSEGLGRGESLSSLARRHGTSRQTVMRLRDAVQGKAGDAQCTEVATRESGDAG